MTCSRSKISSSEAVLTLLVGVAHDERGVAAIAQHAPQPAEEHGHPLQELFVARAVGKVSRAVADHRVVGPPIGEALGQLAAGHGQPQLRVVRRVGGDEVDFAVGQPTDQLQRVANLQPEIRRIEPARATRVGRAQVA
jgi:hypothetical protein